MALITLEATKDAPNLCNDGNELCAALKRGKPFIGNEAWKLHNPQHKCRNEEQEKQSEIRNWKSNVAQDLTCSHEDYSTFHYVIYSCSSAIVWVVVGWHLKCQAYIDINNF
jgi:hypothetical protein